MDENTPNTITSRASSITKRCLDWEQKTIVPEKKTTSKTKIA